MTTIHLTINIICLLCVLFSTAQSKILLDGDIIPTFDDLSVAEKRDIVPTFNDLSVTEKRSTETTRHATLMPEENKKTENTAANPTISNEIKVPSEAKGTTKGLLINTNKTTVPEKANETISKTIIEQFTVPEEENGSIKKQNITVELISVPQEENGKPGTPTTEEIHVPVEDLLKSATPEKLLTSPVGRTQVLTVQAEPQDGCQSGTAPVCSLPLQPPAPRFRSLSSGCVELFGKVDKHHIKSLVLFSAFLSELSENKNHVSGAPVGSIVTLNLREEFFYDSGHQSVEKYSSKDYSL
ncbi:uncharacterized protein O3C94_017984 [Discoglossus pictus]